MKKCIVVLQGMYYKDGAYVHSIHVTRKSAVIEAKLDGFKFNKKESYFYNDKIRFYRELEIHDIKNLGEILK